MCACLGEMDRRDMFSTVIILYQGFLLNIIICVKAFEVALIFYRLF